MFGNWKFKKRKNLCGLGVSAVKKVYRRGAEPPSLKLRRPRDAEGLAPAAYFAKAAKARERGPTERSVVN